MLPSSLAATFSIVFGVGAWLCLGFGVRLVAADTHWALRPLTQPAVPEGGETNVIDRFVGAKLRAQGWSFSAPAPGNALARRVFTDLVGLPPQFAKQSPVLQAALDAFLAHPGNYAVLVDALLATPQHGERWARHWLDAIHFADTHGFEHDLLRPHAWRYRDYVVQSFHEDKPWSQFVREQLAADALFPERPELRVALGFLGAGPYDSSAAATAPKAFEYLDRDDLVTQTMGAFVSTTANCARCHAHKFDPISQEDYFALQAVFAGVGKGDITYEPDAATADQREHWQEIATACTTGNPGVLQRPDTVMLVSQRLEEFTDTQAKPVEWLPAGVETFLSAQGATLTKLEDGSIRANGARPETDTYSIIANNVGTFTGVKLEVLADDSQPLKGPGRNDNGNFHLTEFEISYLPPNAAAAVPCKCVKATADFDQMDWQVAKSLDGNLKSAWGIHPSVGMGHHAVYVLAAPLEVAAGGKVIVQLKQFHGGFHTIGRFRLSFTQAESKLLEVVPQAVAQALQTPAEARTEGQRNVLAAYVLAPQAAAALAALPAPLKVYGGGKFYESERGKLSIPEPRKIHVLHRGELEMPRKEVGPGALCAITELPSRFTLPADQPESARRAALAEWIAAKANPLTWRSIVNRVWHYHFGKGLCDTPGDLGKMGNVPSHPELLDWLAAWFRDEAGGSLKQLHRLIVTSQTYQQTSAWQADKAALDPDNRLLWRASRARLDAESYRDAVLCVTGALDLKMGGPAVAWFKEGPGPQVTPALDYTAFDWNTAGAARRSIYRTVWRGIPDPFMEVLDFPDMGLLAPVRSFSASSLQALVLWNNAFTLTFSEKLVLQLTKVPSEAAGQVSAAFAAVLAREPRDWESAEFTKLCQDHGLAAVVRVLLNCNEFLFVD